MYRDNRKRDRAETLRRKAVRQIKLAGVTT
jgi:hypothetical protein